MVLGWHEWTRNCAVVRLFENSIVLAYLLAFLPTRLLAFFPACLSGQAAHQRVEGRRH